MKILIKITLLLLLLNCLAKMPYGYYQFMRIAGCIGFAYLAYVEFESKRTVIALLNIICAILLNPIIKIHFDRHTWNTIDIIIAIYLLICLIIDLYLQYGKSNKKEDRI